MRPRDVVELLAGRGQWPALRRHWPAIAAVGIANSALPFLGFSYADLSIDAGVSATVNSATPLFAAIVAWGWLFLGGTLSWSLAADCAVVFAGTALAIGVLRGRRARA